MTPAEFARLDALFQAANDLSGDEIGPFVQNHTEPGDIRDRLLKMLSAKDAPVAKMVRDALDADNQLGREIGGYQLLEAIGSGGMGTVYRATRVSADFEQVVAVKLLRAGIDPKLGRRLAEERRLLATLEHPNIARLIDGGQTAQNEPYVVLEYVEGQTLEATCKDLQTDEIVAVVADVCEAVQYAHQRLVVHRDIKPANVLVDRFGHAKLLDFGIAKVLEDDGRAIAETQTVAHVMTPAYASPEQIRGEPISTSSDIYSLGVVLYECLTGRRPFNFDGLSLLEVDRLVTTQRPEPPSRIANIGRSDVSIDRDLDLIVLKAMHADTSQRYGSAGALASDLRAYLDGRPVSARPDTAAYRFRKVVARHPFGAVASLAFVLLLAGATAVLSIQAQRLATERDRATIEARTSRAVSDFMVDLFAVSDPLESRQRNVSAGTLLERGAARINNELKDAPKTQARLLRTTAQSYANLGDLDSGIPLLEQSVEIYRRLGAESLNDLAESLNRLGNYRRDMGQLKQAQTLIGESVSIREALVDGADDFDLADSYNNYGLLLYDAGDYKRAENFLQKSLAMHRSISGNEHQYVGIALHNLALVAQAVGDYQLATTRAQESLQVKSKQNGTTGPSYANTLELLSGVARRSGDFKRARQLIMEAREIKAAHYAPDHPRVVTNLRNESLLLWDEAKLDQADAVLREALERLGNDVDGREPYRIGLLRIAAELATDRLRIKEAEQHLNDARDRTRALYGTDHVRFADVSHIAAQHGSRTGDWPAARDSVRIALKIYRTALPEQNYRVLRSVVLEQLIETALGHATCAPIDQSSKAIEALVSRQRGMILADYARCLALEGSLESSEQLAKIGQQADGLLANSLPKAHPIRMQLARLLADRKG